MSEPNSNSCAFRGRVVFVGKTETLGKNPDKPFYKRLIVVDDAEAGAKYPNPVPFEATGDKCAYLDKYAEGMEVEIDFWPQGRAWKDPKTGHVRYFGSNRIGFIKAASAEDAPEGEQTDAGDLPEDGVADDMPF